MIGSELQKNVIAANAWQVAATPVSASMNVVATARNKGKIWEHGVQVSVNSQRRIPITGGYGRGLGTGAATLGYATLISASATAMVISNLWGVPK